MIRLALLAFLVAASAAVASTPAPASTHGSISEPYAVAAGEATRACPLTAANVGGACLLVPESNAFDLLITVTDGTGLPVGAYYDVSVGSFSIENGFLCGAQLVHHTWANGPLVKVFPSISNGARACGSPATIGEVRVSW